MDFLKNNERFSFLYGGKSAWDYQHERKVTVNENKVVTEYIFADGLKVTNIAKKYEKYDACEWVNYFENTSGENTKILSQIWDCDYTAVIGDSVNRTNSPWFPELDKVTKIYNPCGSYASAEDFCIDADKLEENVYINHIYSGQTKEYACEKGRSSQGRAPFFNIHNCKEKKGIIAAVGWTGQWNAEISKENETVRFKSKVEDTDFFLYPGEKIRTSSVVVMNYEGDFFDSQNKWRRLVREEFSYVGKRVKDVPLSAMVWGGMNSEYTVERIKTLCENEIPCEYIWMDAGWYGRDTEPSLSEWEGDWWWKAGDWQISPLIHPNGMQDIVKVIKDNGKKFILWFEPERANKKAPIVAEKKEYFISSDEDEYSVLLNLGNEQAYNYCRDTLVGLIKELKIDCYRQDFNCNPLCFWKDNDEQGRRGITEIKHINGLYRLWDELLETFPNLIIDNCASGGRRIDIETLKRSIPLSRSDAQGSANFMAESAQLLNMYCALWMPYGGTCSGRAYDTYRMRSAYASCLETMFTFSVREKFGEKREELEWLKARSEEYIKVRPFFYEDMYYLTEPNRDMSAWNAVQWNRPDSCDGMIQVFKHENSAYNRAEFVLRGIDSEKDYLITDIDGGEFTVSGKDLSQKGLPVEIKEKRAAKIYLYKQI